MTLLVGRHAVLHPWVWEACRVTPVGMGGMPGMYTPGYGRHAGYVHTWVYAGIPYPGIYTHLHTLGIPSSHTAGSVRHRSGRVRAVGRRRGPGLNLENNKGYEAHIASQEPKGVTVVMVGCAELFRLSGENNRKIG